MNAGCYKIVFSKRLGALVAVGEHTSGQGKAAGTGIRSAASSSHLSAWGHGFVGSLKMGVIAAALTLISTGTSTAAGLAPTALPTGAAVNAGNVAISTQGAAMTIQQTSDKASVNWNAFNIGSGASVNVQQNSVNSVLLNRVVGNDPSQILGKLTANGQVVLVNPNGIVFGKDGSVAASAFTASTFGISEQDFVNGKYHYTRNSSTAAVTVEHGATLSATAPSGYVAVIGASVDNQGTISTQGGSVLMVAGEKAALPEALTHNVSVPLSGKVRLELAPSAINASVTNSGTITTEGGQVLMQAAALSDAVASITHTGVIDTTGTQGGAVTLQADQGNIKVSGSVKANSTGYTGDRANRGGDIVIGRDEDTGALAKFTDVSGARLESAKGFVETSGDFLKADQVSVKAREWLLDPTNITIAASGASGTAYANNYSAATDSVILASDIASNLNNGTSVTIATSAVGSSVGNIAVNESILKTAGADATLTLQAHDNITVAANKTITSTTGKLNVVFNSDSDAAGGGAIVFSAGSGITSNGGNITLGGGSALNGTGYATADGASTIQGISLNTATINAGGGNIAMNGKTAVTNSQTLPNVSGIYMTGGSISTTGSGTIDLSGYNQNTDTQSKGFELSSGTITGGSKGAVTITGDSRGLASSTFTYIRGALINGTVTSTGGNIGITGYGGSGAQYDYGVDVGGSVIAVGTGAINITGKAGAGGSGGNVGVNTSGTGNISSVDGAISITGTGGIGNGGQIRDHGVQIGGTNAVKSTGSGSITVTGTATNNDNGFSQGVAINSGGLRTNTGNIKIDAAVPQNYQVAAYINAPITSTSGNIYIRSAGANVQNTAAGTISGNNVSIDNTGGTIDANGVITKGAGGASTWSGVIVQNGIGINGSVTAANNLNMYGNQTGSEKGIQISGATTTVSGKNVTLYGKSNSGNGVLLSGATLSGAYLNAIGEAITGSAGFAWSGGQIQTTGTSGTSTASMVKGISAASTTASNGYGALMMFADGSANAANGTTLTLAGEATTLTTGQNTKERGILVQGARTLTMSGDITLDGSSKSSEGIAFGGTVNMSTVTGVTNKLTLKGTTAASSNSALNGVNFSGAINGNAATSSINLIGEAKNLSGTNDDTAVSITGTISGNAANINVQALSNGKITGTGAIGDTTNKNASVTFTQNGTSTYSGAINAANFTKAGAGSLTLDSWNLATPVATNISNAYTIKGGGLSLKLKPGSTFAWLAPVSVNVENASSFSLDANSSSRWNNTAFNFTGGLGGGSMNLAGNPIGAGSTTNTFSTSGGATNTITGGLNANGANVNFNLTAATSGTTLLDGSFAAIAFTQNPQGGYGLGSGSGAAGTVNVAGGGNLLFKDVVKTTNFNINAGAVQLGDGSAATSAATADLQATNVSIASSAKLIFNRAEAYTNASVITGVGSFIQAGAGTLTLTGNSSAFAGATTVNAGKTLAIGTGGSLGVAGSTVSLVDNASQLHFTGASGVSHVGSTIIGAGKVTQSGAGTTILLADNSYTGTTTVSGGTLQVGNAGTTGTLGVGDVTLSNNANLNYVRGAATTIANNISGAGNVSASITGTTSDLAVNHTITLTGGTVNLNADRNLSVTQAISTTNGTDSAVMLVAGKPAIAGTATGGDVMVSGSGSVTAGTNGRVTYMTGSLAGSAGVGTTPGNNRYNSDEVTTNYTTALGSGAYTIYRERPLVTVQINNASKTYDGLTFTGGSLSSALTSGSLIGSDTFAALTANATYGGSSQGAKNVSATPYVISASDAGGKSALGYGMTYTSGALTISKANLVLSGTRVYDASKTFAGQYLSATGVAGETFTVTGIGDASNLTSKNVQTAQALSSVTGLSLGASANGGLSDNYNALSTAASSVSVTAKAATITGTATNTTYNGGTQNQQAETSNGFIAGDAIIITGQASGKNVGTYASSLAVSGNDANNYNVTINNANLVVAKANLVLSGTRVYDASTTFSGQHLTAMGVAGETFTVTGLGDASNLNHKNVQTAQALSSVTGLSLGSSTNGGLSDNYNTLSTTASSVSVTAKAATVTGITASNKTYDGNTSATVSTSAAIFSGQIAGDKLTISSSGTFSDKNAATGKTVALANVLGGADLANYTITDQASTKADIAKKDASITGSTTNTTYNGTTQTQAFAVLAGFVDSDLLTGSVAATGLASGRNAGTYTSNLSATGSDVGNYNIAVTNKDLVIAKKAISLSGITAANKTYDGTNSTVITAGAIATGVGTETLAISGTGTFSDKNAADGKTVTVADITTLTKTNATGDWRNYNLTSTGSATTTANINKKDVTLDSISAASKVYDGTDAADITTGTISGTVGSETLTMSGKGKFSSSAPGTNKLVTVADVKTLNKTNGTGDWNNYNLSTIGSKTTTATITAVPPAPPAPSPSSTSSSSAAARVKIPLGSGNPFQLASVDNLLPDTCSANNLESCFCEASTVNSEISICYEK